MAASTTRPGRSTYCGPLLHKAGGPDANGFANDAIFKYFNKKQLDMEIATVNLARIDAFSG